MPNKFDLKTFWTELRGKVESFYPYYLGFYLLSLGVAIFSRTWRTFFYWPAFHGSVIFFTLLFLLSFVPSLSVRYGWRQAAGLIVSRLLLFLNIVRPRLSRLVRRYWRRLLIVTVVLAFALFKDIGVVDFLVLVYALVSIISILDSRYAAGIALVFLAACPVLLFLKQDTWAEAMAIYAYYFLVITVLTQVRELAKEKKENKTSASEKEV
ncbi:MAG: hypothetical protein WC453_03420 [Patescibacteria group bacterium]